MIWFKTFIKIRQLQSYEIWGNKYQLYYKITFSSLGDVHANITLFSTKSIKINEWKYEI